MTIALETSVVQEWANTVAHLPARASLVIGDAAWEDYEELLRELGPTYPQRIFYDKGKMEIMPPTFNHHHPISGIHNLIVVLRDELDMDIEPSGSTTLRARLKEAGAEPDDAFYVQNAARIIGKTDLDLSQDPPPDIMVEVDRTSSSLNRFAIYARLGVPEIWRLHGETVKFHLLETDAYAESAHSRAFPFLASDALSRFLAQSLKEGERLAAKAFRAWVREHLATSDGGK